MASANKRARSTITITKNVEGSSDEEDESPEEDFLEAKVTFTKFESIRDRKLASVGKCPLCKLGFKPGSSQRKHAVVRNMQDVYDENAYSMPPEEVAPLIIAIYNRDYRNLEVDRKNFNVPVLDVDITVEHLRYHMFTHLQTLNNTIQDLTIIEGELRDCIMCPYTAGDSKSRILPALKNAEFYLKLVKQKTSTVSVANLLKSRRANE